MWSADSSSPTIDTTSVTIDEGPNTSRVQATILSQYANSPILVTLIEDFQTWIDPTVNLQQFYKNIWDISTAQGFGLDIWGIILGVSRYLIIPVEETYLGFHNGQGLPFNNAPFYTGQQVTQAYPLSDAEYLPLLLAKAFANICETSIPQLNKLLNLLFGADGYCYVEDNGNMQMTYYFDFALTNIQYAIVATSGIFPHPTGVLVNISTTSDIDLLTEAGSIIDTENGNDILLE